MADVVNGRTSRETKRKKVRGGKGSCGRDISRELFAEGWKDKVPVD
jgi:hypothetical protein